MLKIINKSFDRQLQILRVFNATHSCRFENKDKKACVLRV